MKDFHQLMATTEVMLAAMSAKGPTWMREHAEQTRKQVHAFNEHCTNHRRAANAYDRKRRGEREREKMLETLGPTTTQEHMDVAARLLEAAQCDSIVWDQSKRDPTFITARVALTTVYMLAVKWQTQPGPTNAADAFGGLDHSTVSKRLNMAANHMAAIRKVYDAAKAAGMELREWNDVIEAIRNR